MHGSEIDFVSKNLIGATFCRNITPKIFVGLVNKISIWDLNDDIFYKQPVFTATLRGSQSVSLRGPNL